MPRLAGGFHPLLTLLSCLLLLTCAACRAAKPESAEMRVNAGDVELYARVAGDPDAAQTLIAIHGGPGLSSDYMRSLEALAGPGLAVVTYDQRGSGRSGEPTGGYTSLEYVADLEAVRQALGADQIHLLGHSWGGVLALRYATVHPDRVSSIVLMGSGAPSASAVAAGQESMGRRLAALQAEGVIPRQIGALADILPAYFSDPRFPLPAELRNISYRSEVEGRTWAALGNFDFTAETGRLNHRVLLLWGRDDPFGLNMAQATLGALERADVEYVLLEGCAHFWQECPEPFFSHVRAFLDLPSDD